MAVDGGGDGGARKALTEATAGQLAIQGVRPLAHNGYKFSNLVKRAIGASQDEVGGYSVKGRIACERPNTVQVSAHRHSGRQYG